MPDSQPQNTLPIVPWREGRFSQFSQEVSRESPQSEESSTRPLERYEQQEASRSEVVPGYSELCMSGAHEACANRDCRCMCHPWSQNLNAQKARELAKQAPALIREAPTTVDITNKCPKCGLQAKATDNFCRADGTRLMLGKQCIRCGAPGDEADLFCWQCAWKHGDPIPTDQPAPTPTEDPVIRARRITSEKGLLKETTV